MTDFANLDFKALQSALDNTGRCNCWVAWNEWKVACGVAPLDLQSIFQLFEVDAEDIDEVFAILAKLHNDGP